MTQNTNPDQSGRIAKIAALNDDMRAHIHAPLLADRIVVTAGIDAMIGDVTLWPAYRRQKMLLRLVMEYDAFTEDNNPDGERNFGDFEWQETRCYWKIDYYDRSLECGSSDPTNQAVTARVLTILRADEY